MVHLKSKCFYKFYFLNYQTNAQIPTLTSVYELFYILRKVKFQRLHHYICSKIFQKAGTTKM